MTAPGPAPAPDRAELAEAEQQVRALARCRSNGGALEIVLAELDRQRALIAAVLAVLRELVELQAPESELPMPLSEWQTRWENAWTDARRALNEGEGR